jgi:hypothetical protein
VRHTSAGRALLIDALSIMDTIEAGYAELVGTKTMAQVRRALRAIADTADPSTAL